MDSESFHLVLATERRKRCTCIPARYVLTILVFWGLFVIYALRANLSVALVAMVNNTAVDGGSNRSHRPFCLGNTDDASLNSSNTKKYNFETDGEVTWDTTTQSIVLGAFYYGYAATQLPGGWIAERFGGKWPFGVGIMLTSLFTTVTPFAARSTRIAYVLLVRVGKGLVEGVTYPAMYALFSRWAPLKQRSLLIAIASVGANLGTILGMPATALFCEHGFDGGWPSAFYICGILGCLWFIPWTIISASKPTRYSTITDTELVHLKLHLGPLKKRPPTPWRSILSSPPVWAAVLARFASYWGLYTLIAELPNYLQNVIGLTMDENGFVNAIVYLFQSIGMIAGGYFSDLLRIRTSLPININRKIFEGIGCIGPAICLLAVPFAGCNGFLVGTMITLAQFLYGFNAGGSIPAMVDLAPDLAGTVSGFVLTIANIAGVFAPMVAGQFVQGGQDIDHWQYVFFITSGVYVIAGLCFIIFGSAELQPWGHAVDVPTEGSRRKKPLLVYSPSASFSGRTSSLSEIEKERFRSRFSTVAFVPERTSFEEEAASVEERGTINNSYGSEE